MHDGRVRVLVEAKAAFVMELKDKHIEQAENYASRAGVPWVVMTNGVEWRLYHLTFAERDGIAHELAFSMNLPELLAADPEAAWGKLSLLCPDSVSNGVLDAFWAQRKALRPAAVVRALVTANVLAVVRRELGRSAPADLDMQDVFNAVRDVISKDALAEGGDLRLRRKWRTEAVNKTVGRGVSVSTRVSFDVTRTKDGVRIAIEGKPETAEIVSLAVLQESVPKVAFGYTERHLGSRAEVGNKGGSLSNRLRDLLR